MLINGMQGLGDNIYQRAFVARYNCPVQLRTPWPQLYYDLPNVHVLPPFTKLRTQSKNVASFKGWREARRTACVRTVKYGAAGILPGMTQCFGFSPGPLTLPDFGGRLIAEKYVLVRPVTVRSEWRADSRNPLPEYVAQVAQAFADRGYTVISVADLAEGAEWALEPLPFAHKRYHSGELDVTQLLNLVSHAEAVIGGIGWIVPAALAARASAWIICGGQGGYNSPKMICPPEHGITFAIPDNFCMCRSKDHACDKRISAYEQHLAAWLRKYPTLV